MSIFNRKTTERPDLPKEYVWELDVEGEDHIYKCVVTETMVTTYEDGVEKKHLKVMNPECKQGVLQIDTTTSLFGDPVPFQLERFIPYIKLEGKWESSDTTKQDRLNATVAAYKRNVRGEIIAGALFVLAGLIISFATNNWDDWYMMFVFGIFFIAAGLSTHIRLKQELAAIKPQSDVQQIQGSQEAPAGLKKPE